MRVPSLSVLLLLSFAPSLAQAEFGSSPEEAQAQNACNEMCDTTVYQALGQPPPVPPEACVSRCYQTHFPQLASGQRQGPSPEQAFMVVQQNYRLDTPNFYAGLPPPGNTAPPPSPEPVIPEEEPEPGPFEALLGSVGMLADYTVGNALGRNKPAAEPAADPEPAQ